MRGRAAACLLMVASVVHPVSARAASGGDAGLPEDDTLRLTLPEAIRRAMRHNPRHARAVNELELNALDRRERWLDVLPTPQLTVLTTSLSWSRRTTAEDPFGEPLPRDVVEWVQTSRSSQGVGMSLSVDLEDILRFRQQGDVSLGRELAVEAGAAQLRADVIRAFLAVQERVEVLELEEALLRTARISRDLARELYVLGIRDRIDLVTLELDLVQQEHALEGSRAALEAARHALRNLIGDPELDDFGIVPVSFPELDPAALDVESLVEVARSATPAVRQAEADLRIQEQEEDLVRSRWLPTVNMFWNSQRQDFVRGGEAFFDPAPDGGWDGNIGVSVSFPDLGQFFGRRIQQNRLDVAVANRREALREVQNQVEEDVRTLMDDLRASARSVDLQARRAELAAERLDLARQAYRLGDQSYLDLQSAQEQAARARRELLSAQYAFERARVELERALGATTGGLVGPLEEG